MSNEQLLAERRLKERDFANALNQVERPSTMANAVVDVELKINYDDGTWGKVTFQMGSPLCTQEIIPHPCIRAGGHDGPCNGFPRKDCPISKEPYHEGLPCPSCGGIHYGSGLGCPYEKSS